LFSVLEDFRFQDGYAFDFRGNKERTINGTEGTLANSNQRDMKGWGSIDYSLPTRLSDHDPISVDLTFEEPVSLRDSKAED
jgi:hypothetical protein